MFRIRKFNIFVFLFFIIIVSSIHSIEKTTAFELYEPGVFNPLGPTLLFGDVNIKKRPYMLIALNNKGDILERSLLQYDATGKLIAEKILSAHNHYKGEIKYIYDKNNNVIEEQYFDYQNNLISKKVRIYKNNQLVQIDFYQSEELIFSRVYKYEKNQVIGREFQKSFSDPFIIKFNDGLISSIEFKDKNSVLMKIEYKYQDKNLIERLKESGEVKSRCLYTYDEQNRLQEYTYYDYIRNDWKKYKSIKFVYADQI